MRQLPARGRATALAVLVVTGGASCAPTDCDTVEPAYAGEASDEAWREMIDARADATTGGDAATFTAPAADAVLGRQAPTFTWDSPLELASSASSGRPELLRPRRASAPGLFDRVVATVLPAAHAHLPPVTGDVLEDPLAPALVPVTDPGSATGPEAAHPIKAVLPTETLPPVQSVPPVPAAVVDPAPVIDTVPAETPAPVSGATGSRRKSPAALPAKPGN
jgi:hypothetical protein